MRSELDNLNHCAVPFLSRAAAYLCWSYIISCVDIYIYIYIYIYIMYIVYNIKYYTVGGKNKVKRYKKV